MVLGAENYAAQGLKAKEPSCVEKVQYLQTGFANVHVFRITPFYLISVSACFEVHVLLYMAMTPVSNVQVHVQIVCCGVLFEMKMKQVFPNYGTNTSFIALFPGQSCVQFLIAGRCQRSENLWCYISVKIQQYSGYL